MESKSLDYTNAMKSPTRYIKGKVELYNGSTLLYTFMPTDNLISIDVDRTGTNGKTFGYTIAQKAKVKVLDVQRAFTVETGYKFKVYLGVDTPGGIEYANFPTFTIFEEMIKRDEADGSITFEGLDMIGVSQRMYAADIPSINYLAYTGPITGYLDALGLALGTTSVYTGAANLDKNYVEGAHVDTFGHELLRNVIRQAAEATGTIAFMDNLNRLCFKPLTSAVKKEITRADYFELMTGSSHELTAINHANTLGDTVSVGTIDDTNITQNLRNNSFFALLDEVEISSMLENVLTTASQVSLADHNFEWRGDPALEIGDRISVNGEFFFSITSDTLSYDGGLRQEFRYSIKSDPEDPLEPSNLPEALKITRARVNKLDQEIALTIKRDEFTEVVGGVENRLDDVEFIMTPEQISQSIKTTVTSDLDLQALIRGEDGADGVDGVDGQPGAPGAPGADGKDGEDGQPTYTWVKYADRITGEGMSDSPTGKRYIGLAFNKPTVTGSTAPGDYEWSPLYDNVQVGGRNYLRESDVLASTTDYLLKSYPLTLPIVSGETYTIQIKGQLGTGKTAFLIQNPDSYSQETTVGLDDLMSNGVYTKTFVADINARENTHIVVYSEPEEVTILSEIEWIKLEKGNVATDWAPAPEDISGKLSEQDVILADLTTISQTNSSLITQTNEAITSLVSQEVHQTSLSNLQQDMESHVAYELDERITNYSTEVNQTFEDITISFDEVTTEIGDLGNVLQTSLDEISTYIRFSVDGIELGEINNPIKLFIENDRIVFTQNDVEVAYINNNRLYITDGQFLNSLQLGNFAFTPRDNGNLSFGKVT